MLLKSFTTICLALFLFFATAFPVKAEPDDWRKVTSQHIEIYTDHEEAVALEVIEQLEIFRSTVLQFMNGVNVSNLPVVKVFLFKSEEMWKNTGKEMYVGGYFRNSMYGPIMAVNSVNGEVDYPVVFHEYLHYLVMTSVPTRYADWYNEGIAEFFSTLVIEDDYIYIGAVPKDHVDVLGKYGFIRPEELFSSHMAMDKGWRFRVKYYASAWLTTHYFTLGARNGFPSHYKANASFLNKLSQGMDPNEAYAQSFDISYSDLYKEIRYYARSKSKDGFAIDRPATSISTVSSKLPISAVKAVLAEVYGWYEENEIGYQYLVQAADAGDAFAMSIRALLAAENDDTELAKQFIDKTLEANVVNERTLHNIAEAYLALATTVDIEANASRFETYVEKSEHYYKASIEKGFYLPSYVGLIEMQIAQEDFDEAERLVNEMLSVSFRHPIVYLTAAEVYIELGQKDEILEHLTTAIAMAGHNQSLKNSLLEMLEEHQNN